MKNKKLLLVLVAVFVIGSCNNVFAINNGEKIDILQQENYVQGYSDGSLGLDRGIKRSEITKLLVSGYGDKSEINAMDSKIGNFNDVSSSHWAYPFITYASTKPINNNIFVIDGFKDGTFRPDKNVGAAELAKMLVVMTDNSLTDGEIISLNGNWPKGWIEKADSKGMFNGVEVPSANDEINREYAFVMYYNALDGLDKLAAKSVVKNDKKVIKTDKSVNTANKKIYSEWIDYSLEAGRNREFDYISNPSKEALVDFFVDAIQHGAKQVKVRHYLDDNINGKELISEDNMNYVIDAKMSNSLDHWSYKSEGYLGGEGKTLYVFEYKDTLEEMQKAEDFMCNWVKLNIKPNDSDETKVRKIHDYLIDTVQYCEGENGTDKIGNHSVYSNVAVVLDGKAVCQGFGLTFQRLASLSGLESMYVSGSAIAGNGEKINHGWNKVKVNGKWYNVDTTYDTPLCKQDASQQNIRRIRNYYLISDEDIGRTHIFDRSLYPASPETYKLKK